jgi:hypothetical protein
MIVIAETHFDTRRCCYYKCGRPGTIYIDANGYRDAELDMCIRRDKWNADRARFIADGPPCQTREL